MTTTQHPEQVEVGEIWEYAADLCQDGNGVLVGERRTIVRDRSGGLWASGKDGGTSIDFLIAHARRVEPAKAACKAPEWCGIHKSEPDDRGRDSAFFKSEGDFVEAHEHLFCSRPCAETFVPPLESKPAETGKLCNAIMPNGHRCKLNDDHINACSMWRAESAAPPVQEAPKAEPCLGCRKAICLGEYLSCRGVPLRREPMGKTTLTESALPERIDRRLAHIAGNHDDDLVTW